MGLFSRKRKSKGPTDEGLRYIDLSEVTASAVLSVDGLTPRDRALCRSALLAAGLASALFVSSEDGGDDFSSPLKDQMIMTARNGSKDAVARAVTGLAWFYPLKLAAGDGDRDNQDVLPWLAMLHQGLHPIESLVVVTDEEKIVDLYERATDSGRFAIGMGRWLAMHLGDPAPELPQFSEAMLLFGCLVTGWNLFSEGLEQGLQE